MKTEISKYRPCVGAVKFRENYDTFQDAWENCARGDWMLWIASRVGVNKRKMTLAKALCAETVIHLMQDQRSIDAIAVAKRYGRYRANDGELKDARIDAYAAYAANAAAGAYAAYAAAGAGAAYAYADANAAAAAYAAAAAGAGAAYAYANAAYAAAYYAAKKKNQQLIADICRKILTKDVLRLINK